MFSLLIIFISAFLVFLVQPMVAKILLPYFGGGAAVWTGCLLFFQALLLAGYGYAHLLAKVKSYQNQKRLHSGLLLLALVNAWLVFSDVSNFAVLQNSDTASPLILLLSSLFLSIGLPYFTVTTTGPLIQHWAAASKETDKPYRLYALSNLGSLLALVSYPFIVEPSFNLSTQTTLWTCLFTLFVGLYFAYFRSFTDKEPTFDNIVKSKVSITTKTLWLFLSATGVIALIATTSAMTQNIPPVPFLWILPLIIYLLSFIITFNRPTWYVRWYWLALFIASAFIALFMFFIGSQFDIISQIVMYSLILVSVCMICHGELESIKPEAENLTLFYVYMALGGVLGSGFVNFVAVEVFTLYYEFVLCLLLTGVLFITRLYTSSLQAIVSSKQKAMMSATVGVSLILLTGLFFSLNAQYGATDVANARNFYGILAVKDVATEQVNERRLVDGTTSHGTQSLVKGEALIPRSYYRFGTGVEKAITSKTMSLGLTGSKVGIVGLGAGTLAAYGKSGDVYTFYELNPAVKYMAEQQFSYLSDSKADTKIVLGDARSRLQQELNTGRNNQFDVLVVDAFSGDSIPMHLLTKEAVGLYWQHLKEDGVLAFHISNSHLDLSRVLKAHEQTFKVNTLFINTPASGIETHDALWVLMSKDEDAFKFIGVNHTWPNQSEPVFWTDDYSDLFSVLQ
jgi:hypothetical protein